MTQLIGFLSIIAILALLMFLFWPVLRDSSGNEFYRTGMTKKKEWQTREEFLRRRISDLDLDRDSGKIGPDEHEQLVRPLREELKAIAEERAQNSQRGGPAAILLVLVAMTWMAGPLHAAPLEINVQITNGTTGRPTGVEQIELLRIQEGMQPLQTFSDAGPRVSFEPVEMTQAPLLVRATFQGDSYISVLRPGQQPDSQSITTQITVYDRGASLDDIDFNSGLQISRLPDGLDVTLVYAANNRSKPARAFDISGLTFPVPDDVADLNVNITHSTGGMPVPVEPERVPGGIRLNRALRPGMSQLSIRFKTDSHVFTDRVDFIKEQLAKQGKDRPFFRMLIWRPADAVPTITGGTGKEIEIPDMGKALQVVYDEDEVQYHFNRGGVWYENPMATDENPIFDHPWESAIGVLLGLTLLLLVLSILTGSGLRLTRNSEHAED